MSHFFKGSMNCGTISAQVFFLIASLLLLAPGSILAADALADEDTAVVTSPLSLPSAAQSDTIRTNVWLTKALMAEIVASSAHVLPAPPAAVQLIQKRDTVEDNLFKGAVVRVLGGLGYEVYLADEDPAHQAAVDCFYSFSVHGVELEYPDVGRTLGLWRRWIDRELKVTAQVDVTMANSGRMLMSDRIQRRFSDRVPDDDFGTVNSDLYEFTTAETSESGWKGRMEELIVLGTLAGLVAVYFANTGD